MSVKMWRCRIKSLEVQTLMFTLIVCDIKSRKAELQEALLGNNQSILVLITNELLSKANTKLTKANGRYQALLYPYSSLALRDSQIYGNKRYMLSVWSAVFWSLFDTDVMFQDWERFAQRFRSLWRFPAANCLTMTMKDPLCFLFLMPSHTLQDCPSAVQLTATLSPNILLSKIWKRQHLENVFQGKASCVRYPFWIEQHIELFFSGCTF